MFTRADLHVEYFTVPWGSPAARITVVKPESYHTGDRYVLRSCKGMEGPPRTRKVENYLVDRDRGTDPVDAPSFLRGLNGMDFLGSLGTDDLEKAIDQMVEELTKWEFDRQDMQAVGPQLSSLQDALRELDPWDPIRTSVTLRSRWALVRELVASVEQGLYEPPKVKPLPDPPGWPWYSRIARLDRVSVDNRTWSGNGRYELRHGGGVPLLAKRYGQDSPDVLGMIDAIHGDGNSTLWAYGIAFTPETARQLCSGQLFASVGLDESGEWELDGTYWRGGTIAYGVALPASEHPWNWED